MRPSTALAYDNAIDPVGRLRDAESIYESAQVSPEHIVRLTPPLRHIVGTPDSQPTMAYWTADERQASLMAGSRTSIDHTMIPRVFRDVMMNPNHSLFSTDAGLDWEDVGLLTRSGPKQHECQGWNSYSNAPSDAGLSLGHDYFASELKATMSLRPHHFVLVRKEAGKERSARATVAAADTAVWSQADAGGNWAFLEQYPTPLCRQLGSALGYWPSNKQIEFGPHWLHPEVQSFAIGVAEDSPSDSTMEAARMIVDAAIRPDCSARN